MNVDPRGMGKQLGIDSNLLGSYAIVKEFIPEAARAEHVEAMIQSIRGLDEIGITPYDCRPCNFRGSRLVDLGSAKIVPRELGQVEEGREQKLTENINTVRQWRK